MEKGVDNKENHLTLTKDTLFSIQQKPITNRLQFLEKSVTWRSFKLSIFSIFIRSSSYSAKDRILLWVV